MLSLRALNRVYRADAVETTALDQVDLDILEGEFVAIMGPSGCGKSTLLNILGMLDRPTGGSYRFDGVDITTLSERALANARKMQIGFIFQSFNLIEELSVRENVELALLYHAMPASERRRRADEVMDQLGIAHRARHRPHQLSGGQQQRVAVARAIIGKPRLILADEPTGNLDTQHGDEVMRMLQALNRDGSTIVMVTHSAQHADYASRIISMLDGRVLVERRRAA